MANNTLFGPCCTFVYAGVVWNSKFIIESQGNIDLFFFFFQFLFIFFQIIMYILKMKSVFQQSRVEYDEGHHSPCE